MFQATHSTMFQAIRGIQDILPELSPYWQRLETYIKQITQRYAYQEIRLPLIEQAALFKRSIGDVTDIVEKEMYTFPDSKGQMLCLRPEGTASCVRALIEHRLLSNSVRRLWYMGPMFRRERPQKGRYRQFHQWGLEAFGIENPNIEAEVISVSYRLWQQLQVAPQLNLQLNSLGNAETRQRYRAVLIDYFSRYYQDLDSEAQRRLHQNPLRLLDSKNPGLQPLIQDAPTVFSYLDRDSAQHFEQLQQVLSELNIPFRVNPRLVRGLDYYNRTVFEWIMCDHLGAQNTVCAGGRYDGLVAWLGGPPTPAVGFAVGLERVLNLWKEQTASLPSNTEAYLILMGEEARTKGLLWAEQLRSEHPELKFSIDMLGGSAKTQFKRADKIGASLALIIGSDEINSKTITIKPLRVSAPQVTLPWHELKAKLPLLLNREFI